MVAIGSMGGACGGNRPSAPPPEPIYARSLGAQQAARSLGVVWNGASDSERRASEAMLVAYLEQHGGDPHARVVRLHLGWVRLAQGRLEEAERLAEAAERGGTGGVREGVEVLRAAILTRRNRPSEALERLSRLAGVIIDADDRSDWARESVQAALLAQRPDEALDFMLRYRMEATFEQLPQLEEQLHQWLAQVGRLPLERALLRFTRSRALPTAQPERQQARQAMIDLVEKYLVTFALDDNDAELAARLLTTARPGLRKGESGRRLMDLAACGSHPTATAGPVIGVVLELRDERSRRRCSEIIAGISRTLLDLSAHRVQLVSYEAASDSPSDLRVALEQLMLEGASIIVSGLSPQTTSALSAFSEKNQLVVVVANASPAAVPSSLFRFVGPEVSAESQLRSHLKGEMPLQVIGSDDPLCQQAEPQLDGSTPSPVEADHLLVLGDAECAARVARLPSARPRSRTLWLGPEAVRVAEHSEQNQGGVVTSPVLLDDSSSSPVRHWRKRLGRSPTWFEAVGHDVATLAIKAFARVGHTAASGEPAVVEYRQKVALALQQVQATLWTSSASGFDAQRAVHPELIVSSALSARGLSEEP